jgi:hypothetical protein
MKINLKKTNINLRKQSDINLKKGNNIDLKKRGEEPIHLNDKETQTDSLKKQGIQFTQSQRGLRQFLRTPIYTTPPNIPISPFDCERWPNSPYCGQGSPIGTELFGLDLEIVHDQCYTGIQVSGTLGGWRTWNTQINWRRGGEECDPPPPDPPPGPVPPPPKPRIAPETIVYIGFEHHTTLLDLVYLYNGGDPLSPGSYPLRNLGVGYKSKFKIDISLFDPNDPTVNLGDSSPNAELRYKYTDSVEERQHSVFGLYPDHVFSTTPTESYVLEEEGILEASSSDPEFPEVTVYLSYRGEYYPDDERLWIIAQGNYSGMVFKGKWADISQIIDRTYDYINTNTNRPPTQNDPNYIFADISYVILPVEGGQPERIRRPPPAQPRPRNVRRPKPKDDMSCCPEHTTLLKKLSADLKKLLEEIQKANKAIGSDEWKDPARVPENFLWQEGRKPKQISVRNLSELVLWSAKATQESLGEFEIGIEIEDSDPLQEGNQKKKVWLNNVAECLGELFMMCFDANVNTQVLINLLTRNITEEVQTKRIAFTNNAHLKCLAAYLGYNTKPEEKELPISINLEAERLDAMLTESNPKVSVPVPDFKDNYQVALMQLLQGANVTIARGVKKLDKERSYAEQIKEMLKQQLYQAERVAEQAKEQGDGLNEWLREAERGYSTIVPGADPTNPYSGIFGRLKLTKIESTEEEA